MGRSAMGCWGLAELRVAVARRGEEPHPWRGELQVRVEAGSKAEPRRVVGLGCVAGRAESPGQGLDAMAEEGRPWRPPAGRRGAPLHARADVLRGPRDGGDYPASLQG